MFTGIIQAIGSIATRQERGGDLQLEIDATALSKVIAERRLAVGESVAVSGACLTVVAWNGACFRADVSQETLRLTTLGQLGVGDAVNLEAALCAGDPLGGHCMTGHVDGICRVHSLRPEGRSLAAEFAVPEGLERFIAAKGSVALDGISLTVNAVQGRRFSVNLIPHTLAMTTLRTLAAGQLLNLEVDLMARYVERGLLHLRP
jgi:riboflavin synthase